MRSLLVYCYFCPTAQRRAGGVQQIVGPLLEGLRESSRWHVVVAHPGHCDGPRSHVVLPEAGEPGQPDQVNPDRWEELASRFRILATGADVVLSVDRMLPASSTKPRVLMSNTLAYFTEALAVSAGGWTRVVAPTSHFARRIQAIDPMVSVTVVSYGLHPLTIARAVSLPPPDWNDPVLKVALTHRPDPRKGHAYAIEGLAHALPASRGVQLEIAWLDEPRHSALRQELKDRAAVLGVDGHVCFRPWLDSDKRWSAVESTHAVLQLGTFEETFGLALVEAVLSGRLALTRVQPAVREVVGPTPLLIEIRDPLLWHEELEQAISTLAASAPSPPDDALVRSLCLDRMVDQYDAVLTAASGDEGSR